VNVLLFSSDHLLRELAEVLVRPTPARRLAAIGRGPRDVLFNYLEVVEVVVPAAVPSVVAADPDDDHVIAAALAASAGLIISDDRHLLTLGTYQTVRIATAADALTMIATG
jgi:uncharacterized protein